MQDFYHCPNPKHDKAIAEFHHHETHAQRFLCYRRDKDSLIPSIEEEDYDAQAAWEAEMDAAAERAYAEYLESRAEMDYSELAWGY